MIDNFKFIREEHYNCLESVLVSLMATWEQEYILMFAQNWGFSFLPPENKSSKILGSRIGGGEYKVWECLSEFYGITPLFHKEEDTLQQLDILRKELSQGMPVLLCLDAYYAPWKDVCGKFHFEHYSLAIEKDDDFVYCIDPFVNSLANPLPMKNFSQGNAKCITISRSEDYSTNVDWKKLLQDAAKTILKEDENINGIQGMRAFADVVESSFDLRKEMEGFEEMIWVSPLILRISDIGSRRLHFASVMKYLEQNYNTQDLSHFTSQIEKAGWGWRRIRRILASACESQNPEQFTGELANEIKRLALLEEKVAQELLKFSRQ